MTGSISKPKCYKSHALSPFKAGLLTRWAGQTKGAAEGWRKPITDGPARPGPAPARFLVRVRPEQAGEAEPNVDIRAALLRAAELERLRGEADSDDKAAVASAAAAAARGDRVSPVCV